MGIPPRIVQMGESNVFNTDFAIELNDAMKVLTNDKVSVGKWRKDGMKYLFI